MITGKRVHQGKSDSNPIEECRSLVGMLGKKTEILYRECRFDENKAVHIRAMASALAALTVLANRLDQDPRNTISDILKDARGFTYHIVRSCDLDLISDK